MENIKNVHILVTKSLPTLENCPERAFWGMPQCGKASRCGNALVFIFFHDRFGLEGRNSRLVVEHRRRWPGAEGDAQNGLTTSTIVFGTLLGKPYSF